MKILVRLPNWLGDMVMSVAFLYELQRQYPGAAISVIAKKGIHELLPFFPPLHHQFIFSKKEYKGLAGLVKFGNKIKGTENFDLFFCLPDSFSSALMGYTTRAGKRIGFKKDLRNLLLTDTYKRPVGKHRVEQYLALLQLFTKQNLDTPQVTLQHNFRKKEHIVVNINSEASSRRLTGAKAVELIEALRKNVALPILLIGAPDEKAFVDHVYQNLAERTGIENLAGTTSLPSLVEILASARLLLTTDSGPAHLANALRTHAVVLFGAGNEINTAPYNNPYSSIIRLGKLSCEPCLKNTCVRYDVPQCLQQLSVEYIIQEVITQLQNATYGR